MGRKFVQTDYYYCQKRSKAYLDDLMNASERVSKKISRYCEATEGKLEGRVFDIMRSRLNIYASAFTYFRSVLDILSNNIQSANNNVCNIMGENSEVSDLDIEEINGRIKSSNDLIDATRNALKKILDGTDSSSSTSINNDSSSTDSTSDNSEVHKKLLKGYNADLLKLHKEKMKIVELIDKIAAADNSGVPSVADVSVKLDALNSKMMY